MAITRLLSGVSLGPDANPLKQRSGPQVNDKSMTLSVRIDIVHERVRPQAP